MNRLSPEFLELKIKGKLRREAPSSWPREFSKSGRHIVRFGDSEVRAAFHHVIPYTLLRDIWNHLVDQHISSNNHDARKALRAYIVLLRPQVTAYVDDLLDQMRATWNQESIEKDWITSDRRKTVKLGLNGRAMAQIAETDSADVPMSRLDRDELWDAAVWPVWNMVEGPEGSFRSDDPKGDFDIFRGGLKPDEVERMKAIEKLYGKYRRNFAKNPPLPIPLDTLRIEMELAAPSIATWGAAPLIQFRAEMWTADKDNSARPWKKSS